MSHLRTYRLLSLLVGLALVFGVVAPVAEAACTMWSGGSLEASMPAHGYEALVKYGHRADMPCEAGSSAQRYHLCCEEEAVPSSSATLLSDTGSHSFDLVLTGVLPDETMPASAQPSAKLAARARAPSFTSPTRRQAFLATFLI